MTSQTESRGERHQNRGLSKREGSSCGGGTTTYGLPPDLLEGAVRRLGWIAFLGILTALAFRFLGLYLAVEVAVKVNQNPLFMPVLIALVGISSVVCVLAWSRRIPPLLMLDFGLVYVVAAALCISLLENCLPLGPEDTIHGISWICMWIAASMLAVPNTPGKTLLATLAAATMGPLGLMIQLMITHQPAPPRGRFFMLVFPNYAAVVWAVLLSRFIYKLGSDVSKAREMGSYTLIETIGKGGMGEVWRAKHRMLARESAIKLIRPEACAGNPEEAGVIIRRFQREAQATAALRSPHTVSLYDFGTTDDGSFYYAMELLDGLDLESLVRRFAPLPPARVAYLLQQACASLAEAHANGLIHRDIKPRNIFLCRLGLQHDFVKVLDFGLVKMEVPTEQTQSQLTREDVTPGTPSYMAPELVLSKPVDPRTDLYSLGCVGYWLLTGKTVFEAESGMAMALAHVQTPPIPPSRRTEREIPVMLENVILACLEKNPESRPQTANEMWRQLAACNLSEAWGQDHAERWWQANLPIAGTPYPAVVCNETTV